jgi:hypothetical protein
MRHAMLMLMLCRCRCRCDVFPHSFTRSLPAPPPPWQASPSPKLRCTDGQLFPCVEPLPLSFPCLPAMNHTPSEPRTPFPIRKTPKPAKQVEQSRAGLPVSFTAVFHASNSLCNAMPRRCRCQCQCQCKKNPNFRTFSGFFVFHCFLFFFLFFPPE